jgi:nuclear-control-of-ATPase protein 2
LFLLWGIPGICPADDERRTELGSSPPGQRHRRGREKRKGAEASKKSSGTGATSSSSTSSNSAAGAGNDAFLDALLPLDPVHERARRMAGRRKREDAVPQRVAAAAAAAVADEADGVVEDLLRSVVVGGASREEARRFDGRRAQQQRLLDWAAAWRDRWRDSPPVRQLWQLLTYRPPCGIVALTAVARLFWTGRIWKLLAYESVEDVLQKESRRRERLRRKGRALYLDPDDTAYDEFGGVERVRRELCKSTIEGMIDQHVQGSDYAESASLLRALRDALSVSHHPRGAPSRFVQDSIKPISRVELEMAAGSRMSGVGDISRQRTQQIVSTAAMTAQVRVLDALLRVCRDRLLKTTFRLVKTSEHWDRRVRGKAAITARLPYWAPKWLEESVERDRLQAMYAQSAADAELTRLGQVAAILVERPDDVRESALLDALKATEQTGLASSKSKSPEESKKSFRQKITRWKPPPLSVMILKRKADGGRTLLSIRKLDPEGNRLEGNSASSALLSDPDQTGWLEEARSWTLEARTILCDVVQTSLKESAATADFDEDEFARSTGKWCSGGSDDSAVGQWTTVFRYIDRLPSWQRIFEPKKIRLPLDWLRRWDAFGIPSSLFAVWLACKIHTVALPYWPRFKKEGIESFQKGREIFQTRVWVPFKGIVEEIMNKSPSFMATSFNLGDEEISLDHMLRDMGCGDGSPEGRREALQKATEQYEEVLRTGLVKNIIRGRLAQHLLIQVQQLKVGLLSTLDYIDVLMRGNRIYFSVLAAIPAFVIAWVGTKLFLRSLYNIRSKDLRPLTYAHREMREYLDSIENLILLSDQSTESEEVDSRELWKTPLSSRELGELLFNVHRYLILMDFITPPVPTRLSDPIHESLQALLGTAGTLKRLGTERQLAWLKTVKEKHQDLTKVL